MFSYSLQAKLVFLFSAVVLLTNALFAVIAISRENIQSSKEIFDVAVFLSRILEEPVRKLVLTGDSSGVDAIFNKRFGLSNQLYITVYDQNWWRIWGDEARIPSDGFPSIARLKELQRRHNTGISKLETFFPIENDGVNIAAIGIGIPALKDVRGRNPSGDFLLVFILNTVLGLIGALLLSRQILKPLNRLMEGIEAFGEGNYSRRVRVSGTGELQKLALSFNRMAATVQETHKDNQWRTRMLDEKLQELWEIYELMRNMSLSLDFSQILDRFLEKAQTLSFSSYGQIILQNRYTQKLEPVIQNKDFPAVKREDYEKGLNESFFDAKIIEIVSQECSMIFVPLVSARKVQGVLFLAKVDKGNYSEGGRRFLETITPVAASLIENASLYEEISSWNQNMHNILASLSVGLATIDRKNRFIIANDRFFDLIGAHSLVSHTSSFTKCCEFIADKAFSSKFEKIVVDYNSHAKSSQETEARRLRQKITFDGKESELELRLMPLFSDEKIVGTILVVEDITDLKRFEQQMIETEKWTVLGRLSASIAHEIRNPLVAIRGLVEIISDEVEGELKEHASVVMGEVQRLNRVVAELLALAKPLSASLKPFDIKALVDEMIVLVRHEAAKNSISISTKVPEADVFAAVDPERIKQALLNIILNAIQAIGTEGNIIISLSHNDNTGEIEIAVANDGPMIEKEMLGRLFEAFYTTKDNGTGLGLSITRKIAELHNGRVEYRSDPEATVFSLVLPKGA